MIDTNCNMRLALNNYLNTGKVKVYNSGNQNEIPGLFPLSNIYDESRSSFYQLPGRFLIGTNNKIYFSVSGVNYTATIDASISDIPGQLPDPNTVAGYVTQAIGQALGGFAIFCAYDFESCQFYFFSNTITFTIRFSQTTDAAWAILGFTDTVDKMGTNIKASRVRKSYPSEYLDFDFGYSADVRFVAILGDASKAVGVSETMVVRLHANSIPNFDTPALTINLSPENYDERGIFKFLDDLNDSTAYRYWRLEFFNSEIGGDLKIHHIYLGDYQTITMRNVSTGFNWVVLDPSEVGDTVSGQLYYNDMAPIRELDNLQIGLVNKNTADELRRIFQLKRTVEPFFCSLDPKKNVSKNLADLTVYCKFSDSPSFGHVIKDFYNFSFKLREVI